MPRDYILTDDNKGPIKSWHTWALEGPLRSAWANPWVLSQIYARATAEAERFKKALADEWKKREEATFKQSTGNNVPTRPIPTKKKVTPLEIEVNAIVRRYQIQLHKVPDLAAA